MSWTTAQTAVLSRKALAAVLAAATATAASGMLLTGTASANPVSPTITKVELQTGLLKGVPVMSETAVGPMDGTGAAVYLTGTNLDKVTTVRFGAASSTKIFAVSATNAWVDVPAAAAAVVTANDDLAVNVVAVGSGGGTDGTKTGGYTYKGTPVVTGVTRATDGKTIDIAGKNLGAVTEVKVGPVTHKIAKTDSVAAAKVTIRTPSVKESKYDLTVVSPYGSFVYTGGYTNAPTVSRLSAASGTGLGGTVVRATGTALRNLTSVTVDSASVDFVALSDTEVIFKTPAYSKAFDKTAKAKVDVVVENAAGKAKLPFTYLAMPTLAAVASQADTTSSGPLAGGTVVTLTGTNLLGVQVLVDTVAAKVDATSTATSVKFTVPKGKAAGSGKTISVKNANGVAVYGGTWTYNAAPTITSLTPATGPKAGGTTVAVAGSGFTAATKVFFGTKEAVCTYTSASAMSCASPAATSASTVAVKVANTTNGVSLGSNFVYTNA